LGWFVNDYAGRRVVKHTGTAMGFVSWMAMMPEERLGVVILSNLHRTGINLALRNWVFDRLLARPDRDWSTAIHADYSQGWQRLLRGAKEAYQAKRPAEMPPPRPLEEYVGDYESPLYGSVRVADKDGQLTLRFGNRFLGVLEPWQGDTFRAFFPNPRLDDWLVTFKVAEGRVVSLRAQESPWAPEWYEDRDDLGEFRRQYPRATQ
jgi:hypothetical protein